MFDNLNTPNSANRQSVDDIFAETDQVGDAQKRNGNSEIVTRRVGLAASSSAPDFEVDHEEKSGKGFKIAVVVMVVVIVGLLGFLAYSKFFASPAVEEEAATNVPNTPAVVEKTATTTTTEEETASTTDMKEEPAFVTEIPAITTGLETATTTTVINENTTNTSSTVVIPIDSDNDGLNDDEELNARTNINLLDSDNDGLSDYAEIRIYKTNPLVADTDSDGYLDGQEVQGGYNPNGAGKLPGNN